MDDIRKVRWFMGALLGFLVSGCYSYEELRYAAWSRTAEARVSEPPAVVEIRGRRGATRYLGVNYSFQEEGGPSRHERDLLSPEAQVADGQSIRVQYLAGEEGASRVEGNRRMMPVYLFLGFVAVLVFFVAKLAREANEPIRGRSARKETRR